MGRISVLALALTALLGTAQGETAVAPVLHFSFYAPAQKDPPVRVVGFEHDDSHIGFVLSNTSDKSVVAVIIARIDTVPRGCTLEPPTDDYSPVKNDNAAGFKVSIAPHGRGIAAKAGILLLGTPQPSPRYPHWIETVVESARRAGAGFMQVQFGITGVFFGDGTTWPDQIAFMLHEDFDQSRPSGAEVTKMAAVSHPALFDPSLVEAEEGKCSDVAAVAGALESVKEVVFEHKSPASSNKTDDESATPHLRFSCSLEGPKAVCRLPLEPAKARGASN